MTTDSLIHEMKKEIPILFSTPMVQAILADKKTMTRRILNNVPDKLKGEITWGYSAFTPKGYISLRTKFKTKKGHQYGEKFFKQRWFPGDLLWVRETWQHGDRPDCPIFKAGDDGWFDSVREGMKWKPSIFMPKEACRIWLEVIEVRVERLHEISDNDCFEEGLQTFVNQGRAGLSQGADGSVRSAFQTLWDSINGNWVENPWVWVIEFKKISR